jgi:hypothetical protein
VRQTAPAGTNAARTKKLPPFAPPAILNTRGGLLSVRWPSGNVSPILFVKEKNRWLVDVLNGPGGEILLLKE